MKLSALSLIAAAVLSLAACSKEAETSVPAESAAEAPAPAPAVQTLAGSDGKISIVIQGSNFEDAMHDETARPAGIPAEELTLLQRDNTSGITLYAANLGAPKTDAKTYFANLKSALESAEGLAEIQTGAATDTRMNYRFVQTDKAGEPLRENCIAIYEANLYNVCASSTTASQEELAAVLKEVNLTK